MQLISALQDAPAMERRSAPLDDLVFIDGDAPGITRRRANGAFVYQHAETQSQVTEDEQERIEGLGIPPAWRKVWICATANGYLQATGLDDAGRKQYRYHPAWRAYRERTKFSTLIDFGAQLPRIRRCVRRTFREHSEPDRELVTAALVRLLDNAPLRIGNPHYVHRARGASTLKKKNVRMLGDTLQLDYTAKGGKRVRRQVKDSRLLGVLEEIDDLPGKSLFRYVGTDGEIYQLRSEQVNSWLQDVTGNERISAKSVRTWAGSLAAFERAVSDEALTIKAMSAAAARTLRNTPAVARSGYIHPAIIGLTDRGHDERGELVSRVAQSAADLTRLETAMLRFLAEDSGISLE